MRYMAKKGKMVVKKWGFWGLKVGFGAAKIMGWQPNEKGKMVQNAGGFLKIEHIVRRERLEIGAIYLHYGLYFR